MQPYFLPHRPYYGLIHRAHAFVVFDDVQFCRGWQQRNQILLPDGTKGWITVPVISTRPLRQQINQVRICRAEYWAEQILGRVERAYRDHPHFDAVQSELSDLLRRPCDRLVDLTVPLLRWSARRAGIPVGEWHRSSDLGGRGLPASERLVHICRTLDATTYLSGPAARSYLQVGRFHEEGIHVTWHEPDLPSYPQRGRTDFDPRVSILDLLMNCGPDSGHYF